MSNLFVRSLCASFLLALLISLTTVTTVTAVADTAQARVVRIKNMSIERGQEGMVILEIDAQGDENTIGFSLNFDITQLSYVSATLGTGVPAGSTLLINSNQTASGRLGIAISLPFNQSFPVGTQQLLVVRFAAGTDGNATSTPITFGDVPVPREIVKPDAQNIPLAQATFTNGTVSLTRTATTVSAASFIPSIDVATESIAAVFGTSLATGLGVPQGELPEELLGTSVTVKDSANTERRGKLFFVFNTQVNFQIPPGTALGQATVTVRSGDGKLSTGTLQISSTAPGIFAANADGKGVAAAQFLRIKSGDPNLFYEQTAQLSGQTFIPLPLNLGPETDQVFLILYGTGIRFHGGLSNVSVTIGNQTFPVLYADVAPGFVGLDQINVGPIPRSFIGAGVVDVKATVNGKMSNTVTIQIQ